MGDFQSFQISSLKRFGMEEGPMYYVIRGCRSTIIDRHGMKHPWSDPARNTGTDSMWRAARLNSKHSAAVVLMQTKQSMAVYNLWQMGGRLADPAWLRDFPRKETECGLLGQAAFSNLFFVTCHRESCWSARAGQYFQPCQSFIQPPVSCACPVASGTTKPTKPTLLVS